MADYMVHAWRLSDFSGDICAAGKAALGAPGKAVNLPTTSLKKTATETSFFITDEGEPTQNDVCASARSLSVLTDKVTIDQIRYDAGQKIEIEFVLTTDGTAVDEGAAHETAAPKFIIGHIADAENQRHRERLVFSTSAIRPGQTFGISSISDARIKPDHTICFARGATINTPHGEIPVEDLGTGDEVVTRDGTIALIQWVGKRRLTGFELAIHPHLRPIRIRKNALGPNRPERDLIVSPQHRVLVDDWRASYFFGEDEVLVPARSLLNDHDVVIDQLQTGVDYYHVLLKNHELLSANGLWAESLFPSTEALETLTSHQKDEIESIIPGFFDEISKDYVQALPTVRHDVAAALAA